MDNLTENIKKAFDYKNEGQYKEAIDYFYKAFTVDNDSVEIMNELAHLYSKLNQIDRAIDFCEQILVKNPDDYDTRIYISKLYKKQKNYEKARKNLIYVFNKGKNILKTAEELFSILKNINDAEEVLNLYYVKEEELTSSAIYCYVGWAYYHLENEYRSEEYFRKAFETDKGNVEAGSRIAEIMLENGSLEEAESLLNNLLKYAENDKVFYILAEIFYIKANYDKAINYYTMAIKHNDKNTLYYYKLGGLYVQKGFFAEAEECYNKAIYIEPDNLLYNYTLAYLYFIGGKYDFAKTIIEEIFKKNKDYKDAIVLKLQILLKEKNLAGTYNLVDYLLKYEPKDERIYYILSLYYSELNILNKAIYNIQKAISLNGNSCEYYYELASYYLMQKKYNEALKVVNEIISINDKFIQAYILSAKINLALEDYQKVNDNIEKALVLDTNMPEIYYIKGIIAEKNNNTQKAIENYKIAISMAPSVVEYYEAVADSYYLLNEYENAFFYYKEASDLNILEGKYKYYMAKCCEKTGKVEMAISNYSMARRLSPTNIDYIVDYVKVLAKNNRKKQANSIIKSSIKLFSQEEKNRLKQLMK